MTIGVAVAPCARDDSHGAAYETNRSGPDSASEPDQFQACLPGISSYGRSTTFPNDSLDSMRRCASAMAASGNT